MLDIDRNHFWGTFTASVGEGLAVTTIRQLIEDVWDQCGLGSANRKMVADALLASPLADIIDLAAEMESMGRVQPEWHPEVRELLAEWRASRAERPTP